jgi:hypothetical protein
MGVTLRPDLSGVLSLRGRLRSCADPPQGRLRRSLMRGRLRFDACESTPASRPVIRLASPQRSRGAGWEGRSAHDKALAELRSRQARSGDGLLLVARHKTRALAELRSHTV